MPGKTSFPQDWSDSKIIKTATDIANEVTIHGVKQGERTVKEVWREGIHIRVIVESPGKGGGIVSAYPINLPKNPK